MITKDELLELMTTFESDRVERTTSFREDKLGPAVCALSNDLPNHRKPGYIFIGVKDDGSPAGLSITDEKLTQLGNFVLISTDSVILPVASDLFSLQGIKNLGQTLINWRRGWDKRKETYSKEDFDMIPSGDMQPKGYIVMQYTAKEKRPVKAYLKFANRIPEVYSKYVLQNTTSTVGKVEEDENCLGLLKHYHSLAPMSMEANKPMFLLKPSDGAIGAHVQAVRRAFQDF